MGLSIINSTKRKKDYNLIGRELVHKLSYYSITPEQERLLFIGVLSRKMSFL